MKRLSADKVLFQVLGYGIISFFTLLCLFPFLLMISGSLTSSAAIAKYGYSLWPRDFSWAAYEFVFRFPEDILRAYSVTIGITLVGTVLGLLLISMTGYVLQRRDFRYRNGISFFLYFTTIFQGGLIPWYILLVNVLQVRDTYFVLIWNVLMSPFLIILMRSFIQGAIPHEMTESAKMDGAGDFTIYRKIVLPLCTPALATIGLFLALAYWNDWFQCALFIDDRNKYTLQYFLYNALNSAEFTNQMAATSALVLNEPLPGESAKLAMSLVTMGPILLAYPLVQRYFVKGITVGAVKG